MGLSVPHLLVVLAIVMLVFGTKRLQGVGADWAKQSIAFVRL
ncbi:twin-arginine translocase TatA/TatE family subunit [Methylomonas sp. UP202]